VFFIIVQRLMSLFVITCESYKPQELIPTKILTEDKKSATFQKR